MRGECGLGGLAGGDTLLPAEEARRAWLPPRKPSSMSASSALLPMALPIPSPRSVSLSLPLSVSLSAATGWKEGSNRPAALDRPRSSRVTHDTFVGRRKAQPLVSSANEAHQPTKPVCLLPSFFSSNERGKERQIPIPPPSFLPSPPAWWLLARPATASGHARPSSPRGGAAPVPFPVPLLVSHHLARQVRAPPPARRPRASGVCGSTDDGEGEGEGEGEV
jgi:hypothetical protein